MIFQFLANAVLIVHVLFVAFVVATLPGIFLGGALGWRWVRLFWLRFLHLVCIGIVSAEAWGRISCPLTTLENGLPRNSLEAQVTRPVPLTALAAEIAAQGSTAIAAKKMRIGHNFVVPAR